MSTFTSTFTASNGTQSKTLVHDFNVTAAPAGISYVGGITTSGASTSIPLPAACQASDLLYLNYISSVTPTAPAGSTAIVADNVPFSSLHMGLYGYFLTAADITAGSVAWNSGSSSSASAIDFFRGVHASIVDVQSPFAISTSDPHPQTPTADSITTAVNGDMLVFSGLVRTNGGIAGTFTTAPGFTKGAENVASGNRSITTQYQTQAAVGATGSVSCSFENNNTGSWAAILVALKPA